MYVSINDKNSLVLSIESYHAFLLYMVSLAILSCKKEIFE